MRDARGRGEQNLMLYACGNSSVRCSDEWEGVGARVGGGWGWRRAQILTETDTLDSYRYLSVDETRPPLTTGD